MIQYSVVIEDNDYLWNSTNNQLVKYQTNGSVLIGSVPSTTYVQVAFPIPLNEDVLEAIGFLRNDNAEYANGSYVIKTNGTNPESILQIEGTPIRYLSDIQNFCRTKGNELYIDETKLADACKNFSCKPQP